jgi:hypothetical protein
MDDHQAPPRRYRLLLAAAGIPLLALVLVVSAVTLSRRDSARPHPQPSDLVQSAPTPTVFASLVEPDDFTLSTPQGFGALTAPESASLPHNLHIDITLLSTRTDLPARLPVWHLATPTPRPDVERIAARFGIAHPPDNSLLDGTLLTWREGLSLDTVHFAISWLGARGVADPHLGGVPRDTASALQEATQWLNHAGLAPDATEPVTVVQTSRGDGASFAEWRLTWERSAPGYSQWPVDTTVARVSADGTLKELQLARPPVAGGSMYRLRPWQDALRDAQAGHWFQPCCAPLPDPPTPYTLHATIRELSLAYAVVDAPHGAYAVPMYAFTEHDGDPPGLVPALAP